jgi:RNA polymerase sigma-70 factor (ECF subfamily)
MLNPPLWDWSRIHQHCLREARRHTSNQADAEDVAQDAALRAWRNQTTLNDPEAMEFWLSRITRNEAMRLYERVRPECRADLPENPDDSSLADRVALKLDVRRALSGLSERDQHLVALRYVRDLTCSAAAEQLDIPLPTAKVRLHRIRGRLARALAVTQRG